VLKQPVLHLGDCLEVMEIFEDNTFNLMFADLPYGTTSIKWDTPLSMGRFWNQIERVCKPDAAMLFTAVEPFASMLGASNIQNLKYKWYWIKSRAGGFLNAKKMPMKNVEEVLVFYRKLPTYNPQDLKPVYREMMNSRSHEGRDTANAIAVHSGGGLQGGYIQHYTNYPRQTLEFASEVNTVHPTQKPVALLEYLLKTYTNSGDKVLDPTMGSGTTGVAAKKTACEFVGIENDRKYFNIAVERLFP